MPKKKKKVESSDTPIRPPKTAEEAFEDKYRLKSQEIDSWVYQDRLWAPMDNGYIVCTKIPEGVRLSKQATNPLVSRRRVDVSLGAQSEIQRKKSDTEVWDNFVASTPVHKKFIRKQTALTQECVINRVPATLVKFGADTPTTIIIPHEGYHPLEPFMDPNLPDGVRVFDMVKEPESGLSAWQRFASECAASKATVVEDIETFGPGPELDPLNQMGLNPLEGSVRLVQHSVVGSEEVLIWDFGGRPSRVSEETWAAWSQIRRDMPASVTWVHHRTQFDLGWLAVHAGVDPLKSTVYDTWAASKVFWSGVQVYAHDLGALARRLGVECHDKQLQKSDWGADRLFPAQYSYAAGDVIVTGKVFVALRKLIDSTPINNSDQIALTMRMAPIIVGMNTHGYPTDLDLLNTSKKKAEFDLQCLHAVFDEMMECEPTKTAEVLTNLDAYYGIKLYDTTQATLQECQHPVTRLLMDIRALKMRVDYMSSMVGSVSPLRPHRSFTHYNVVNTQASGRVSASAVYSKQAKGMTQFFGFNGLNPPKDGPKGSMIPSIRKLFAAQPGYVVSSTDLSGAHLRIALFLSGQTDVLDQMVNSPDGHAHTSVAIAKQLGGKYAPYDTLEGYFAARAAGDPIVNELRELAKRGIYSVINICSGYSLQNSFAEQEIFLSLEDCKLVLAGLWDRLPKVKKFVYDAAREAARTIALTTPNCRRPSTSYKDYRTLYSEEQESAYYDAIALYGKDSKKVTALADKPIGFARVVSYANRMRYFPIYERVNTWGAAPRVDRSISAPAVASHLWASVESTIMSRAAVQFTNTFTLQGHPNCRIWAIPYDEMCLHMPEEEALEAVSHLSECMREAWDSLLPGVPGVTAKPEEMLGASWADVH